MTVTPTITVAEGKLVAYGRTILTGVPDKVVLTQASGAGLVDGAFVGAAAAEAKSLHVFTFGTLRDLRFMCCFRFKLWWMTQRMGTSGRDVPLETQFMLLERGGGGGGGEPLYLVMLPLLEGQFRAALQGNDRDELEICIESGDKAVQTAQGTHMVYMHAGANPFDAITQAVKVVERHLQTFHHREKKKLPSFVDWFGWCTWDAFYTDVTAEGVKQGLQSLAEGGTPPRFLIIDDGWQQIGGESKEAAGNTVVQEGAQFASRLTGIKENAKFQKKAAMAEGGEEAAAAGLRSLVEEAKKEHGVKYVYVWHALAGYWGGVKPAAEGMEHYESALAFPVQSPGVTANQPDIVMDSLAVLGLGLVHPRRALAFYDELHAYLASCGVDGVKVDVQNIIETLGAGHGGRVELTRAYHRALEASVARHFPDNGCISCMCHGTDMLYSARQTAVVRASDDFYPRDPASHTVHVSSVAYNTLFLGEFMHPDWDMFHSLHPAAEYHGAARAIGGCPIYVSDKPGNHNFELLKKLVLPDGSVLRAQLPGRPTRDCLFADPARDGTSLLKIWNVNKCTGVVGVFNCQGAGWCRVTKKTRVHDAAPGTLTGSVRADDVDAIAGLAGPGWTGEAVVYAHRSGGLTRLPRGATLPVTLKALAFELFHVCPATTAAPGVSFAPIGLLGMFNSGGAVEGCDVRPLAGAGGEDTAAAVVVLRVRGCGRFGAYSSRRPARCALDAAEVEFSYDAGTGLVALDVPVPEQEFYRWTLEIQVQGD
uniref:galactinol--sucrose galactosyltransferase n=1 Tax=Oryza brachyantha TaxID=4533 RepID=J3LTZ8_ORYBR